MVTLSGYSRTMRNPWFEDQDGAMATTKPDADVRSWSWDWTAELGGDTVSSAAYVDNGTTRTNAAVAGNVTSCDVGGSGSFDVTVTTAGGDTVTRTFRFYAGDSAVSDYG